MNNAEQLSQLFAHPAVEDFWIEPNKGHLLNGRGVLMCGQTSTGICVHDHQRQTHIRGFASPTNKYVDEGLEEVPYDPDKHGAITRWYEEGEEVATAGRSTTGQKPIHRNTIRTQLYSGSIGEVEFHYE